MYRMAQIYNYQTSNFDLHYAPDSQLPDRMNRKDASEVYNNRIRAVWDNIGLKYPDNTHNNLFNKVRARTDRMLKREIAIVNAEKSFDEG